MCVGGGALIRVLTNIEPGSSEYEHTLLHVYRVGHLVGPDTSQMNYYMYIEQVTLLVLILVR